MFGYAWRSIVAVMTAFYLFLSTGACAVHTENDALAPVYEIPLGKSSVAVLQSDGENGRALQIATERYAQSLGVSLSFTIQTVTGDDYRAALRSRLMAGEEVDLFHLRGSDDVARLQPWLENMSMLPWIYDAVPGTLDAVTAEGAVYGAPYSYEGIGFVVNRGIFEAAGIPLADIRDFEDLSDAFYELRDQIDAGDLADTFPELVAVADIAVQDSDYLGTQLAELLLSGSYTSPARTRDSAPTLPDAEGAGELITLLARVSPQRTGWTEFAGVTEARMVEGGIATERVAVILHSTDSYRRIYAANAAMEGKLALLPVYLPDSEQGAVYAGPSAWWAIRAEADESVKEVAGGLLTWLYQTDEGGEVLADGLGLLSPYERTARTGVRLHQELLSAQEQGLTLPRLAPEAPYGWGTDVFAAQLREYFTAYQKEWADVVEECRTGWAERLE